VKWLLGAARQVAALSLAALLGTACAPDKAEYSGIGPYSVKRTKLHNATGRCEPTELPDGRKGSWCSLQPRLTVGGRPADVDLYFLGVEPGAPLIEIQLEVRGCHDDALSLYLRKSFGDPVEDHGTWLAWKNANVFVIGLIPSDPGACRVRVFPLSEQPEIDRVRAKLLAN